MKRYIFLLIVVTLLIGCNREGKQIPTTQVTLEPVYEKPVNLMNQENTRYVKGRMEGELYFC